MSAKTDPQGSAPLTLASAGLPPRVRRVLERVLALMSVELEVGLTTTLNELEQELFRLADRAQSSQIESTYLQALRTVRYNRADLLPRLLQIVEAGLADIRRPRVAAEADNTPIDFRELKLVDDRTLEENARLNEIASRQEVRASLPLHLLAQRFGVLAGAPALDAERLPVGPRAICRALRDATRSLHLEDGERDLLFTSFERHVMGRYPKFVEELDQAIAREGILPGLTYVPIRLQPRAVNVERTDTDTPAAAATPARPPRAGAEAGHGGRRAAPVARRITLADAAATTAEADAPYTGWGGGGSGSAGDGAVAPADDEAAFSTLRQLLAGRRQLMHKLGPGRSDAATAAPVNTADLLGALDTLQRAPGSPTGSSQGSLGDIRNVLLAQARHRYGPSAALSPKDHDTFELLSLLYRHIETEIRPDAPAAELIRRLQVPLLQVALRDPAFFVRAHHPARELLSTVAEAAAKWLGDDDFDPQLLTPLQQAVNHVVKHYDGDIRVFEASNRQLQAQLEAQVRKAELLERRHIEAARGKERLESAKQQAERTLQSLLDGHELPRFPRGLLTQAWADVLTLTLLRQGEDSTEWQKLLDATRQMIAACGAGSGQPDPALVALAERSLKQVGYHDDEAGAIAVHLAGGREDEDDAASRTELAIKLKARARLGEESNKAGKAELPPRTPAEQERYDQVRTLPFGTWFEFVTNQQGDVARRRLSWYSTISDHALFVNARGQRVAEMSLDALARTMAAGQARIVTVSRARLVDRAWTAAVSALRNLTGGPEPTLAGGAR